MTAVNGASGPGSSLFSSRNNVNPPNNVQSEKVKSTTPIQVAGNSSDVVGRKELGDINPYSLLGVEFKTNKDFKSRVEAETAAMFPGYTGYFKLDDPQKAVDALKDVASRIAVSTERGTNRYLAENLNGDLAATTRNAEKALEGFFA